MKLAYCPTDVRKIRFYVPELLALDDLFTLSYYTPPDSRSILADPGEDGWVCGSHIVVLHRDEVLDPASGRRHDLAAFAGAEMLRSVSSVWYRRGTGEVWKPVPVDRDREESRYGRTNR